MKRLIATDLSNAARHHIVEPLTPSQAFQSHPDIKVVGARGGVDYLDVTFEHTLVPVRLSSTVSNLLAFLAVAFRAKVQTHGSYI